MSDTTQATPLPFKCSTLLLCTRRRHCCFPATPPSPPRCSFCSQRPRRYFLLLLLIRINNLRLHPSALPPRNAPAASPARALALHCTALTLATAVLDSWNFPIQLIVLALILAVGARRRPSQLLGTVKPPPQVLYTEFRAARVQSGGNGGAFIAAMALLALAAVASAADASGWACRRVQRRACSLRALSPGLPTLFSR